MGLGDATAAVGGASFASPLLHEQESQSGKRKAVDMGATSNPSPDQPRST